MRANISGALSLLTWGKVASYHVDPIEKKPLFHFLPGSKIFSLGTYGCNFGCEFCQNWEISQTPKLTKIEAMRTGQAKEALNQVVDFIDENSIDLSPKKIVELSLRERIPAIAFTYNEPAIFAEYAYDTMRLAKRYNIFGVFVSSGYESKETMDLLEDSIDAYNIDLKGATEDFYRKYCHTTLRPVLETIEEIVKRKRWLEITTLLIPGVNTSQKDLRFIARFIAKLDRNIPWHVTAFSPHYKMADLPPTDYATLHRAYEIGKNEGLRFVYTGNLPNVDTESTYCPSCRQLLIFRAGYEVAVKGLNLGSGRCRNCQEKIYGVWH